MFPSVYMASIVVSIIEAMQVSDIGMERVYEETLQRVNRIT